MHNWVFEKLYDQLKDKTHDRVEDHTMITMYTTADAYISHELKEGKNNSPEDIDYLVDSYFVVLGMLAQSVFDGYLQQTISGFDGNDKIYCFSLTDKGWDHMNITRL